ncbi:MAG: AAA family ATPase, partial [Planctomycetota bacterium]
SGLFPLNENIHIKLGTSTPEITNLYYLTAKVGEKITSLKNRIEEENVLLTDYENKIKNIEKELAQKRTTVYEINVEIDNKTKEYNNISKEVEVLTNEIEYLNTSINLIDRKIDNLLENKQNLLLRKKNIEELIANIKNRYEQNITLLEDIEKEFQTITGQIEELKARQNNESNKIKNLENNLVEYKNKLYRIGNQLEEIEKKKTDNEKATQQFETSIQNLGRRLEMNNQLYHFWGKFKDSLCEIEKHNLEQYKTLAGEIEKIRNSYSQKKNSIYQICFKLGMLTEKMDEIKRVCLEELGQQYELIEQNYQGIEEDIDTLKQTIKQYDNKIANFKNINMNAIDKLNALNEELEVYRSEYNKLFVIHRELIEFLDNLEKEASSIFENTISTLSDSFNKYIRKMFEGGRGRLQLSKNGIDYEVNLDVQIPNKNIKNLDSFSGGERALISLALLFSLLELKPSPFYVLDEIDASLDDNNLSKLLGLLKEFSYNHQILMITHNKHTLNIADYIIGVTIGQESFTRVLGISWEKALSYAN